MAPENRVESGKEDESDGSGSDPNGIPAAQPASLENPTCSSPLNPTADVSFMWTPHSCRRPMCHSCRHHTHADGPLNPTAHVSFMQTPHSCSRPIESDDRCVSHADTRPVKSDDPTRVSVSKFVTRRLQKAHVSRMQPTALRPRKPTAHHGFPRSLDAELHPTCTSSRTETRVAHVDANFFDLTRRDAARLLGSKNAC